MLVDKVKEFGVIIFVLKDDDYRNDICLLFE